MSEFRKDPVVDRWVIISPERGKQAIDFVSTQQKVQKGFCPFCYGSESKTPPEVMAFRANGSAINTPGWDLRVVPNKFPALILEGEINRVGEGMFDKMSGNGAHEIIIESPNHDLALEELPVKAVEDCLWAYQHRMNDLNNDDRFRYILIFKNHGEAAGATLEHTHSQLIALPIVPELLVEELAGARRHYDLKERCIYCDIIAQEQRDQLRVVSENDQFIAICPYAPRFPFETWVLPKYHSARFETNGSSNFPLLAQILKVVLLKIRKALNAVPYNYVLHTAPCKQDCGLFYHWHLEIMPKVTKMAGFEQGTGCYINHTSPEEATEILRAIQL